MDITAPDWKSRLNDRQKTERLEWHENKMREAASQVGKSLKEIKEDELYKPLFPTFEEYCEKRLNIHRARIYQILQAQSVRELLGDSEVAQAANQLSDKAAIALDAVPEPQREQVLKSVIKHGKPTEKAIRQFTAPKKKSTQVEKQVCPHCGKTF